MADQQEPYILMSRHDADTLMSVVKDKLQNHNLSSALSGQQPAGIGLLKTIESSLKSALEATNGIVSATTFHLSDECLEHATELVENEYDGTDDAETCEMYRALRYTLRVAAKHGNKYPFKIAPKYYFELCARGVCVAVFFSEDELRKLASGTHEAVVFTAVVPPDPTDSQ